MGKGRFHRLDTEIKELLTFTAENSTNDLTLWMDIDSIAWALLDSHTIGARRKVRQRLLYLLSHGMVERCNFDGITGWRLKKHAADKCCGK